MKSDFKNYLINKKSKPEIKGEGKPIDKTQREFNFLTWNIGYAGLGKEMDFFYEGGKQVRPTIEQNEKYLDGIKKVLLDNKIVDFILLQEVDVYSKRSWYDNEFIKISKILPKFFNVFITNYDARFVPLPIWKPMGRVISGMANYLQIKPDDVEVCYFKASFYWPKRLFFIKRCYVLTRFSLDNGKDLVVFNIHNSAYGDAETLRKSELEELGFIMQKEYNHGNYVVAGGDWNNNPRGFSPSSITSGDQIFEADQMDSAFLPDWQYVFDSVEPSNRNVDMPYQKGLTSTTILDFFVVSPNIEVKEIKTFSLGFEFSDHNPVSMKIELK